jgi:SIR2-like domain
MTKDGDYTDSACVELAKQIRKGECVLFLGAGIHAPPPEDSGIYNYPPELRPLLGGDLAEKLAEECHFKDKLPGENVRDLQRVSLCFESTPGLLRAKLVERLNDYLVKGKKPSPLLKMLAALPFRIIVTTNYDGLMEAALRQREKDPRVLTYDPNSDRPTRDLSEDPTEERPLVFKMHGDLEHRDSVVITDEDYITFVQKMSEIQSLQPVPFTIRFRMQKWVTLFVGYSLRDYNLRLMFRIMRWRVDTAEFPPSFSVDRNPDPLIRQVWQNERKFITFVPQDVWSFVPWLYRELQGQEYAQAQGQR